MEDIMSKVMSLHDAVEKFVHDGDAISLGGFTTNRKPYAAVHEILRQGSSLSDNRRLMPMVLCNTSF